ncbi:MAG: DUF2520 domain-containing protein [Aequorivita sp.]
MIEVVLLGFGNLNSHLLEALYNTDDVAVKQVFNRNQIKVLPFFETINFTDDISKLVDADVYIIGIPDDAISAFSQSLPFQNKLVVHTSGGVSIDQLASKNRRGVFYPLQSFSKTRKVDFRTIPICIEAENNEDMELLRRLGQSISTEVVEISSGKRAKLHLAAVFVNNFVNHLYQLGSEILEEEKLPFKLLQPLILETALKIETLSPEQAQTGPAKRKDVKTIEKHLHLLKDNSHKEIYKLFTEALGKKKWD